MKKANSPYYAFMAPFFERGIEAEIKSAKNEYRKIYKANWRKAKRKINKEITICVTQDEWKELNKEAKQHNTSLSTFIKKTSYAYVNRSYVVPQEKEVRKILQVSMMIYNRIEQLIEEEILDHALGTEIRNEIYTLEREVRIALLSPLTLEQRVQKELEQNVAFKQIVLNLLKL